jgi:hypothetical protein
MEVNMNRPCGLYRAGHCPHWIAMNLANAKDAADPVPATLLEVGNDGNLRIGVGAQERSYWNHQPGRLVKLISALGPTIELQPNLPLLWVPSESGRYAFSLAPSGVEHVECRVS